MKLRKHVGKKKWNRDDARLRMDLRRQVGETKWNRDDSRLNSDNVMWCCRLKDRGAVQWRSGRRQLAIARHRYVVTHVVATDRLVVWKEQYAIREEFAK